MLNYTGDNFVEILRRTIDFPRRGVLDPVFPDFSSLTNEAIAKACGATHCLRPETSYLSRQPIQAQFSKGAGVPWNRQRVARASNRPEKSAIQQVGKAPKLSGELTPLDGTSEIYVNGPFVHPTRKLDITHCCLCWNWGKDCKYLNPEGLCRKLHICSHDDCRTLHHHGHRLVDHSKKKV